MSLLNIAKDKVKEEIEHAKKDDKPFSISVGDISTNMDLVKEGQVDLEKKRNPIWGFFLRFRF